MWQLLAKPLLGVVTDSVRGFVETKKAKAELAVTEIKAAKALKEQQIAGKISWEASAVDQMKGSHYSFSFNSAKVPGIVTPCVSASNNESIEAPVAKTAKIV